MCGYQGYYTEHSWVKFCPTVCSVLKRWSPPGRPRLRGHILKSLASKVKSLALRPQVLENWPVLDSRTALFFELLKFCRSPEKNFRRRFLLENAWKNFLKTFFLENTGLVFLVLGLGPEHSCPWAREGLSLERLSLALASDFFCVVGLGLEPCLLDCTSGVLVANIQVINIDKCSIGFRDCFLDALYNRTNNSMFSNKYCICLFKMGTRSGRRIVSRLCECS